MSKNAGKQGTPKRGRYLFLCGTPKERCMGSNTNCNHGLQNSIKMHGTPEEAFNCYGHDAWRDSRAEAECRVASRAGRRVGARRSRPRLGRRAGGRVDRSDGQLL